MGWYIQGNDFPFDIRVDNNGLSVSGEASQVFRSSLDPLEIKNRYNRDEHAPRELVYLPSRAGWRTGKYAQSRCAGNEALPRCSCGQNYHQTRWDRQSSL